MNLSFFKSFHYPKFRSVHSRDAHRATLDVLMSSGASRVLLHAFGGSSDIAKLGVEAGYYFSVPPSFARGDRVRKTFF